MQIRNVAGCPKFNAQPTNKHILSLILVDVYASLLVERRPPSGRRLRSTTPASIIAATMPLRLPLKLLEISVVSAQDLPPVSKLMRTYAVAWIQPDRKFKTRVDRQGHTNPTWNDKFVICVDNKFLNMDDSAVTIEIYTLSWLRDIPIGTVRVLVNDLIAPSSWFKKKSNTRIAALQIRRPSGHLQGILNVGINLLDSNMRSIHMPLSSELSRSFSFSSRHEKDKKKQKQSKNEKQDAIIELRRSQSVGTMSFNEEFSVKGGSAGNGSILCGSELSIQKKGRTTNGSPCSYMRPLPSEVAAALAKGLYSTTGDDVGSSIFDGWTVAGDSDGPPKLKIVRWTDDHTSSTYDRQLSQKQYSEVEKRGGLLSCFGIVCGYECNIACGKPKSDKKNRKKWFHDSHSDKKKRLFYTNA